MELFLILKESITNAAKHSGANKLSVNFMRGTSTATIIIRDNGSGIDYTKTGNGNGLKNMKHRAREIKALLTLTSEPGKGTTVSVEIPIT